MALVIKNPPANAGDIRDSGSIPGSGRPPGGGHDNPLQYSRLENPMNRGQTVQRIENPLDRLLPGRLQSIGSQGIGHN